MSLQMGGYLTPNVMMSVEREAYYYRVVDPVERDYTV